MESESDSNPIRLYDLGGGVPPHRLHDCLPTWWETLTRMRFGIHRYIAGVSPRHLATFGCWRYSATWGRGGGGGFEGVKASLRNDWIRWPGKRGLRDILMTIIAAIGHRLVPSGGSGLIQVGRPDLPSRYCFLRVTLRRA